MNILFDVEFLLRTYGYLGIFVIVLLESGVIFALPGDSLLFTAGLLASVSNLNLFILIPVIFIATFLGGMAGYFIGVYIESLHRYAIFRKILKPEYIIEAHKFFENHGRSAIILSRFVPVVRTFTPIVAGIARMSRPTFIRYSLVSAVLWSSTMTLLGYFLGRAFPWVKDYLLYFIIGVVIVSILPGVWHWLRTRSKRRETI